MFWVPCSGTSENQWFFFILETLGRTLFFLQGHTRVSKMSQKRKIASIKDASVECAMFVRRRACEDMPTYARIRRFSLDRESVAAIPAAMNSRAPGI